MKRLRLRESTKVANIRDENGEPKVCRGGHVYTFSDETAKRLLANGSDWQEVRPTTPLIEIPPAPPITDKKPKVPPKKSATKKPRQPRVEAPAFEEKPKKKAAKKK